MARNVVIAALGLLGWVVSYAFFYEWLAGSGWDLLGGWRDAFTASTFGTGLLLDLVAVTGMMVAVAVFERRRIGTGWALAMVLSLSLSASVSLAIYLLRVWSLRRVAAGASGSPGPSASAPAG